MMRRVRQRSTTDLLILMIASTICLTVLVTLGTVSLIEIIDPTVDTDAVVNTLSDIINTLIGLLAGFLAGRTEGQRVNREEASADEAA